MDSIITNLRPIDLSLAESKPALIAASPTMSVKNALELMSNTRITSLPVYSHKDADIVSIVNLLDILLFLLQDKNVEDRRLEEPVERVLGLDIDRESYRMHKTDRLDKLAETLNAFASGIHRSLVVNFNNPLEKTWLLSQTDIIRHVKNHPDSVIGLLDLESPVEGLELLSSQKLITASDSETALNVYKKMADRNLGGVPVVDQNGKLLFDICIEDLPNANLETINQLSLSCKDYIEKYSKHTELPVATPQTKLKVILDQMIHKDSHRVWIVESQDSKIVKGVITMSDIMALLCHNRQTNIF